MKTDQIFELLQNRKHPKNAKPREFYNIAEGDGKRASLYLYDAISWWSYNDAQTFRQRLDALDAEVIDLHINSPGGSVFEGVAIYNLLLAHPAKIVVHVDGLAASIASVIMLAGDEIHIAENAMVMIHNPSAWTEGGAEDFRRMAASLDAVKESILNTYESRTSMDRPALAAAMDSETWYGADEAVSNGFASKKVAAQKLAAKWDASDFAELPENAKRFGKGAPAMNHAPEPPREPETVGTVADVAAARARAEQLLHLHANA